MPPRRRTRGRLRKRLRRYGTSSAALPPPLRGGGFSCGALGVARRLPTARPGGRGGSPRRSPSPTEELRRAHAGLRFRSARGDRGVPRRRFAAGTRTAPYDEGVYCGAKQTAGVRVVSPLRACLDLHGAGGRGKR
jgi:hypothetical protein